MISGFNVGLIAWLLEWALRLLGAPRPMRLAIAAAGVGAYALLTGFQPPVTRAMVMAWVVLGAQALDRAISWPNTLAAAALVLLLADPAQLWDPGFQLSFGAVASLLLLVPEWSALIAPRLAWIRPPWLASGISTSLCSTGAAWIGLAPVVAWYAHLVSPIAFLANLLVAPLVALLVSCGTTLLVFATAWPDLLRLAGGLIEALLHLTVALVRWCQEIPGGHWIIGTPSWTAAAAYYGLLAAWLLRRPRPTLARWLAAGAFGCLLAGAAFAMEARRWLRVDVLDVGHGDSLVIRTPGGRVLVVDTGTEEAGSARLVPFLTASGVRAVDLLVLTHPDSDHWGGALPLLEAMPVRRVLTNGAQDATMTRRLARPLAARGLAREVWAAGARWSEPSGVTVEALHPPSGFVPGTDPASNDNSLVLKLTFGACDMLLTGDLEEAGIPWLLRGQATMRSEVLKVPHHGSRLGGSGARLLAAVRPALAVLSVGREHHLPSAETVRALAQARALTLSTRQDGAVRLRTRGEAIYARITARPGPERVIPCSSE